MMLAGGGRAVQPHVAEAPPALAPDNCGSPGWTLLAKMGWRGNTGLGKREDGRAAAAHHAIVRCRHGIGHHAYGEQTQTLTGTPENAATPDACACACASARFTPTPRAMSAPTSATPCFQPQGKALTLTLNACGAGDVCEC